METTNTTNVYTLTKTELKNGKFQYIVTDQNGNVISNRTSARHYVACTADGGFYFGRLDLIGKGTHGLLINDALKGLQRTPEQLALHTSIPFNVFITECKERLQYLNEIAYLNQ